MVGSSGYATVDSEASPKGLNIHRCIDEPARFHSSYLTLTPG